MYLWHLRKHAAIGREQLQGRSKSFLGFAPIGSACLAMDTIIGTRVLRGTMCIIHNRVVWFRVSGQGFVTL